MRVFKKVKAGALQYALVISVLIALIVFAFISLVYLQQKLTVKNDFYKEAIENVQTGFDYIAKNDIPYNELKEYSFTDNAQETTTLFKKHWGVFDLAIAHSKVKNEVVEKVALLGNNNLKRQALYLEETNKPLVVVGNTKITGNVSLPKQGIKTGNISGVSYYGNELIYGNTQRSTTILPKIQNIDYLKNILKQNYVNDSIIYFELEDNLKRVQKFTVPTAVYQANGSIVLRDVFLQGNIIIHSQTVIKVESSAIFKDVILIAPTIEVLDNVVGNFQCFASKKITVGKNCNLNYPSALVVINEQKPKSNQSSEEEVSIVINEKTAVKGIVIFDRTAPQNSANFKPQIVISKNAEITGEVYCSENFELLGSVSGSVYTQNFITKQSGSVYVNHIYNGTINSKKLPEEYCGLAIGNSNLKVAKWLY